MIESEYRIVYHKCKNPYYEIHRVYYNKNEEISRIVNANLSGQTIKDLQKNLGQMLWTDSKPVIDWDTKKEINT